MKKTVAPVRSSTERDVMTGVRWATPLSRAAAASMSAKVGKEAMG